jgi:selenocysteine lyase/cysteine desulfurase
VRNAWDFFDYQLDMQEGARRYENGTFNAVGISGYHGALQLFQELGFDHVADMVRHNATYTYHSAKDFGFEIVTPAEESMRAGIVTFRHNEAEEVQKFLLQRRMVVSARVGHIRVSPHCYNSESEIDAVLECIRDYQGN